MNKIVFFVLIILTISCIKPQKPILVSNLHYINKIDINDTIIDFKIYNFGRNDLVISDFSTSCDCAILNLVKNTHIKYKDSILTFISFSKSNKNSFKKDILITLKTNTDTVFRNFHFIND
jgi:hypothetical protein